MQDGERYPLQLSSKVGECQRGKCSEVVLNSMLGEKNLCRKKKFFILSQHARTW